jgi:phage regulator Rha-like protein
MGLQTPRDEPLTMSSREIAELTGKRHDNVMTDIRSMLEDLGLHAPEFSGTYRNERGNTYECFNLPKDLTITLVAGYSTVMRHRIVRRWPECLPNWQAKSWAGTRADTMLQGSLTSSFA